MDQRRRQWRDESGGRADGREARPYIGTERRACPRFEPTDERAWVVWERGEAYEVMGVRLLDISRQGALLDCKEPPSLRRGDPLWFALPASCDSGDVPARVIALNPRPAGRALLRVRFEMDCPDDLFFAAVDGLRAWLSLGGVN